MSSKKPKTNERTSNEWAKIGCFALTRNATDTGGNEQARYSNGQLFPVTEVPRWGASLAAYSRGAIPSARCEAKLSLLQAPVDDRQREIRL